MEYLWKNGPQSPVELHESLSRDEALAYTTIHTELSRLLQKGFVVKNGRNLDTRYNSAMSREEYLHAT
ncbi:MAG: BlaI/MecI/CopY family transcriptional regulator, partial [Candidatus Eremiobacteraeota bacterium]|nr:BlaI/MecI/CopY family transcriptional regulator [Candidatus Eremiobacteraeota bacterium]